MADCKLTTENISFCWDARAFETAMYMVGDDFSTQGAYSRWGLLNQSVLNESNDSLGISVENRYQAFEPTSMNNVCYKRKPGTSLFRTFISLIFGNLPADILFSQLNGECAAYERPDNAAEQEEILTQLKKLQANEWDCRQGFLFGAAQNLMRYLYLKDSFRIKLTDENSVEYARAAYAKSVHHFFTDDFAEVNEAFNNAKAGFNNSARTIIYGLAPVYTGEVDAEKNHIPLPTGYVDKMAQAAIDDKDSGCNAHFMVAIAAFKRFNDGIELIGMAQASQGADAKKLLEDGIANLNDADRVIKTVNLNKLDLYQRSLVNEFQTILKAERDKAGTVKPPKAETKPEPRREKRESGGGSSKPFDCDTPINTVVKWPKKKRDAFARACLGGKDGAKASGTKGEKAKGKGAGKAAKGVDTSFKCGTPINEVVKWPEEKRDAYAKKCLR